MIPGSEQTESGEDGVEGGEGGREGEIPPLITSWVTGPAGRCQNPTLSDVRKALENGRDRVGRERKHRKTTRKSGGNEDWTRGEIEGRENGAR